MSVDAFATVITTAAVLTSVLLGSAVRAVKQHVRVGRDNVRVESAAMAYVRVVDGRKSMVAIENVDAAIRITLSALRNVSCPVRTP